MIAVGRFVWAACAPASVGGSGTLAERAPLFRHGGQQRSLLRHRGLSAFSTPAHGRRQIRPTRTAFKPVPLAFVRAAQRGEKQAYLEYTSSR